MESMPSVRLGAMIFSSYALVFVLRHFLIKPVVLEGPQPGSGRQMAIEFAMGVAAGLISLALGQFFFGFPPTSSLHLVLGFLMAAFFIALDMALFRERQVILHGRSHTDNMLPQRFFSVTRKFSLVAMGVMILISIVLFFVISKDLSWLKTVQFSENADMALRSVTLEILFIMGVFMLLAANLIHSYSKNIKLLFENETGILEKVTQGDLTGTVPVVTNDEFGVIAGHTNHMIDGLSHRMKLLGDLKLAEEIQQNLLPDTPPEFPGLDVFGKSVYCAETGGDYFDYLQLGQNRLGVVVADASDHGVGAALYMTTARALFRSRAFQDTDLVETVDGLNRDLFADAEATGRFMTMFYMTIDPAGKTIQWVRAGHDPALLYDPQTDDFEEFMGKGTALGVMEDIAYEKKEKTGLKKGQALIMATDGVWEAHNPEGTMFGKNRMKNLIRENISQGAQKTVEAVLEAVRDFRGGLELEDDVTILVAKFV